MAAFLADRDGAAEAEEGLVRLPDLLLSDLLDDLIQPIARDGAGMVEVAIRLQRSLGEIAAMAPESYGIMARYATEALTRSAEVMTFAPDIAPVRDVYSRNWGAA